MQRLLSIAVLTVVLLAAPRPAHACKRATNGRHKLDPAYAADRTPPSIPSVSRAAAYRRSTGCCSYAVIEIDLTATDDTAPPKTLGYRVRVAGGIPPTRGEPEPFDVISPYRDREHLVTYFATDAPAFKVTFEIRAVDLNGNVGPPVMVTVGDAGIAVGCCGATPFGVPWGAAALAMLVLAVTTRRRRRC